MPAVFIHGVPDTFRVWDPVREHLFRTDLVAFALPGFDSPVPPGFNATKEGYVAWVIQQIEQMGEPVDLVAHDWGCLLALRVASLRPDLVRTWAAGGGPVSKDYVWHPLAQLWQTPGAGEEFFATLDPLQLTHELEGQGVPAEPAKQAASHVDSTMAACILRLYRSAVHVGSEWQPGLAHITAPGLVLWGENDSACPAEFADHLSRDTQARRTLKLDTGHWFLLERAAETASALEEHWAAAHTL